MNYFKRLINFAKPFWKYLLGIGLVIIIMSGIRQVEPLVLKQITDKVANKTFDQTIISLLLLLVVVKVLNTVLNRASWYLANIFSYKLRFNLREIGYKHLLSLPLMFFNSQQSGKLMSQLGRGTTQITQIINNSGAFFLPNTVTAIVGLIIVSHFNLWIALAMIGVFVPVSLISYWKFIRNQDLEKKENYLYDHQYGHFWETISAIELIKSFVAEEFEFKQFKNFHQKILDIRKKVEKNHNLFAFSDVLLELWTWGIYVWVVLLTFRGNFTLGTMVLMLSYVQMIREPLWTLNWMFWEVKRAQIGAKDFFEILDTKTSIKEVKKPNLFKNIKGHIIFDNVTFNYKNGSDVFDKISFEIKPGTTCALVGRSGAGKTTVAALLNRYFDTDSGRILIDAINIKKVRLKDLRTNIGLVSQEPYLFAETIEENLRYGKPSATKKEMEKACQIANAHEFIMDLEKGYASEIGERGTKLSGGQKQRLSIARAILKDPPILVLDEATSQLDSQSEFLIQQALKNITKNRTTIIIAHRLSTAKKANKIIVFDKGKILEQGTHNQLMKNNKLYASLFKLQSGKTEVLEEWDLVAD